MDQFGNVDDTAVVKRRRLVYTREQFDDYWIALISRIHYNDEADKIVSGRSQHPLFQYQSDNADSLVVLRILPFTLRQLIEDPAGCYRRFSDALAAALQIANPVPNLGNLTVLEDAYTRHNPVRGLFTRLL